MPHLHEIGGDNMNPILFFLLTLLGFNANKPVHDLRKTPTKEDSMKKFNAWVKRNIYIILFLVLLIVMISFVAVCFLYAVSMTESGTVYNHLGDVI